MRSLLGFFSGVVFALCATAASAQDLVIDVDQSFTAHPERFGLTEPPHLETEVVSAPAPASAVTANEAPPVGEDARLNERDQGNGEAATWDDQERRKTEAAH